MTHNQSYAMPENDPQLEMLGNRGSTVSVDVQEELARGCRSRHHALVKCFEVSNLTAKQVYGPLDIDQAVFSRILSGNAFLDPNKKLEFMRICGNIIPVRYDALCVDHELKPIQSTLQQQLEETRQELHEERRVNRRLVEMLRGK